MQNNHSCQRYMEAVEHSSALYNPLADLLGREGLALSDGERRFLHIFPPVAVSFVEWLLEHARTNRIKRLYFLSRDGYHFYNIALKLCSAKGLAIECRYLNVSRYSLRQGEYYLLGNKSLELICVGGVNVSPFKILKRANLTDGQIMEIASRCDFGDKSHKKISYRDIQSLKKTLYQKINITDYILPAAKDAYDMTTAYLRQEGFFDNTPSAIVDSGWIGTTQQSLQRLMRSIQPDSRLEGYYFGLFEIPDKAKKEEYHCYYFSPQTNLRRKVLFSNSLFEAVLSAPEGMTTHYSKEGSLVVANKKTLDPRLGAVYERFSDIITLYTDSYIKNGGASDQAYHIDITEKLLSTLMGAPDREDVNSFGELLFCDDMLDDDLFWVAAELSVEQIKKYGLLRRLAAKRRRQGEPLRESAWIEGSIVRTGYRTRHYLRQNRYYKSMLYLRKSL